MRVSARTDGTSYDAELGTGWQIGAGVNGGMLLATLGNALAHAFADDGHPDPVAISAYYLSASRPGPATVRTEVLRRGRSMSTGQATLVQARGRRRGGAGPSARDVRRPRRAARRRAHHRHPAGHAAAGAVHLEGPRAAGLHGAGQPAGPARPPAGPVLRGLGARGAVGTWPAPGLAAAGRRAPARPADAAARRRRAAAGDVRPRHARLDTDAGALGARAGATGAGLAARSRTGPGTSPVACSRRTPRSGTPPDASSRSRASSRVRRGSHSC